MACFRIPCYQVGHAAVFWNPHRSRFWFKYSRSKACCQPTWQHESREWLQRSELILGAAALEKLASATVTVVGLGGVGSWCAEMLCRTGVGHLVLLDGDVVDSSNRNRQLPALSSTVGIHKVDVRFRTVNAHT
jgi:tRNA A37 threonylcarbamoyladenosine dehydratase